MGDHDDSGVMSCSLPVSVCADDNVCLSRVISPSSQFFWKYSTGKFTRIEGDGKIPFGGLGLGLTYLTLTLTLILQFM